MTFSLLPHLPRSEAQQPDSLRKKKKKKQQLSPAKCPQDLYECTVLYVRLQCHLYGTVCTGTPKKHYLIQCVCVF